MAEQTIAPIIRGGESFLAVDAATTTGLAKAFRFILPQDDSQNMTNITIQATGTFSVATIGVEVSLDGGVTFGEVATAVMQTTPVVRNDVGRTGIYRIRVKTFTGTSVTLRVAIP